MFMSIKSTFEPGVLPCHSAGNAVDAVRCHDCAISNNYSKRKKTKEEAEGKGQEETYTHNTH